MAREVICDNGDRMSKLGAGLGSSIDSDDASGWSHQRWRRDDFVSEEEANVFAIDDNCLAAGMVRFKFFRFERIAVIGIMSLRHSHRGAMYSPRLASSKEVEA